MSLGKIPGKGYVFTNSNSQRSQSSTLHVKDPNLNGEAKVHGTKIYLQTKTLEMLIMFMLN